MKPAKSASHTIWSWALWIWVAGAGILYLLQFPEEARAVIALLGGA
jgi:hypothetical protein